MQAEQWKAALAIAERSCGARQVRFHRARARRAEEDLVSYFEQQAKAAGTRELPELANEITDHLTGSKCSPIRLTISRSCSGRCR